jgi:hypothetical protein
MPRIVTTSYLRESMGQILPDLWDNVLGKLLDGQKIDQTFGCSLFREAIIEVMLYTHVFIDVRILVTFFKRTMFEPVRVRILLNLEDSELQTRPVLVQERTHVFIPRGSLVSLSRASASPKMLRACRMGITVLFEPVFRRAGSRMPFIMQTRS